MAKAHLELFFERFLEFNLERYKDDPVYLPLFTGLTFADVSITNVIDIMDGERRSSMVVSARRRFRGVNQTWTPAPADTDLELYMLRNSSPLNSLAEAMEQTEEGMYSYIDGDEIKAVVVIDALTGIQSIPAVVERVFRSAINYEIYDVTVPANDSKVVLVGNTYGGILEWVKGKAKILIIPETDYGQLEGDDV